MSASLVGSEMCIRDRPPKTVTCQEPRGLSIAVLERTLVHKATAHNAPVSYTHLTLPTICSV
eukprot:207178-Alexandrium_andersonii.AAC.1